MSLPAVACIPVYEPGTISRQKRVIRAEPGGGGGGVGREVPATFWPQIRFYKDYRNLSAAADNTKHMPASEKDSFKIRHVLR